MVYRGKKRMYRKKRYNKKRYNRKRSYRKKYNKISTRNMGLIIPDRARIKFKYTDTLTSMVQSGTSHWYLSYKANDLISPGDAQAGTSASLAPNGVQQWENFYRKYKVNACKIHVQIIRNSASASTDTTYQLACVRPITEETYSAFIGDNATQAGTDKYARSATLANSTANNSSCHIRNYMTTKKLFGYHYNNLDTSESLIGELGTPPAAPSELWYWIVTLSSFDGVITLATDPQVLVKVDLTYYCELFDRPDTDMEVLT